MRKVTIKQKKFGGFKYSIEDSERDGFIILSQKTGMDKMDSEDYVEISKKTIPELIKLLKNFTKKRK